MSKYINPEIAIIEVSIKVALLAGSAGVGSDGYSIGFGGIDFDGIREPESRKIEDVLSDIW